MEMRGVMLYFLNLNNKGDTIMPLKKLTAPGKRQKSSTVSGTTFFSACLPRRCACVRHHRDWWKTVSCY